MIWVGSNCAVRRNKNTNTISYMLVDEDIHIFSDIIQKIDVGVVALAVEGF